MKHAKKIIKCHQKQILLSALLLCFMSVAIANSLDTSAVTYQTGVGVNFTLNPKLTLSLSSANLLIPELAPGTSGNSNEITITVSTNAAYGYNLSASVGNNTTYNNRDLTHTAGATSGKFQSIAFQADLANYVSSFTTDNTWGYSIDSGTKYNGLPLYSDTTNIATLKATDSTPTTGTDTVNFLIGAKASTTQPTGDYNNVINFIAVSNPVPMSLEQSYAAANKTKYNGYYKMQDMNSSICAAAELEDDILQVIDVRDNEVYKISKLKDGKCWMTENLNIAGGTALSTEDTDFVSTYTLPTTDGWTVNNGKLVLPASATKNTADNNLTDNTQFGTNDYAYVFNSGNKENCGASNQNIPCYSYYSWDAATLGSGRDIVADGTDVLYSICPKNWRLPTSGVQANDGWKRGDFYALATSYGSNLESSSFDSSSTTGANFFNNAGSNTVPGFLLTGLYHLGTFYESGNRGFYWSSTSYDTDAHVLVFSSKDIFSAGFNMRTLGHAVRCLAK